MSMESWGSSAVPTRKGTGPSAGPLGVDCRGLEAEEHSMCRAYALKNQLRQLTAPAQADLQS